jgi:hypothetical protein
MSAPTTWGTHATRAAAGAVATLFMIAGCGPAGDGSPPFATTSGGASAVWSSSSAGPQAPIVVLVDPNRTLNAQPGQGVGVFTEYQTGGHWHVWWTCDTAANGTGEPCFFQVAVSVPSGKLIPSGAHTSSAFVQPSAQSIDSSTTTTTSIDQIYFDASPGQAIELDARLNGIRDGRFLFFVQNGVVNGGYTGMLSDPLILSPGS